MNVSLSAQVPKPAAPWICAFFLALTLGALFYPMFASGFDLVPGDLVDARFNNYSLEHTYLWVVGRPDHRWFWNSPVGYPTPNMVATSENLLGSAPIYWLWRALHAPPDFAFQLWLVAITVLDFFAARAFLRRALGVSELAAGVGSFVFCAAAQRAHEIVHAQLFPQFFSLWALYALVRLGQEPAPRRPALWWLLAASCLSLQLWAGFYLAWFTGLALLVCAAWGLVFPSSRRLFVRVIRRDWRWALVASGLAALTVLPFIEHSLDAASLVGWRSLSTIEASLPFPSSWVLMTSNGPPRSSIVDTAIAPSLGTAWPVFAVFVGLLALWIAGLWRLRARAWMPALAATFLTLLALCTRWPHAEEAWLLLRWFPGWAAIRAVYRVGIVLLVPAAIGLASAADGLERHHRWLARTFALLLVLTQLTHAPQYSRTGSRERIATMAALVPPSCRAFYALRVLHPERVGAPRFFLSLATNTDAMLTQAQNGIPTFNSYSTQGVVDADKEEKFRQLMPFWFRDRHLDPDAICLVFVPGDN